MFIMRLVDKISQVYFVDEVASIKVQPKMPENGHKSSMPSR